MSRNCDGADDKIQRDSTPVTAYPLTIACWFKADGTVGGTLVSITYRGSGVGVDANWFRLSANGGADAPVSMDVNATGGGLNFQNAASSTNYAPLKWHFAAGVFTSTTSRDVYLDGGSKGSNTTLTPLEPQSIDTVAAGLLARALNDQDFAGKLAYVQIFNRALDVNEINQIMRIPGSVPRGLVLFWNFLGGSPEPDYSGNGNSGTVTGATVSADNPPINGMFLPRRFSRNSYVVPATPAQVAAVVGKKPSRNLLGVGL